MVFVMITIFLIYSLVKGNKNKEYSVLALFPKYEKRKKVRYKSSRSRSQI